MSTILLGQARIFESSFDGGSNTRPYPDIRSLVHPRHSDAGIRFVVKGAEVFELQKLEVRSQGSLFVGETVYPDGGLFITTLIDPCFLLLSALRKFTDRFVPLEQILSCGQTTALNELLLQNVGCESPSTTHPTQHGGPNYLRRVCDVKDMGDGNVFYRFSEDKVANWLKMKVLRVARKLDEIAKLDLDTHRSNNGGSGMADGFTVDATLPAAAPSVPTSSDSQTAAASSPGPTARSIAVAVDLVSEYVDIATAEKIKEMFGLLESANMLKRSLEGSAATASKWSGRDDADEMAALAFGQKKVKTGEGPSSKTPSQGSVANKRLQTVNKKGMKSMTSFFAAKPKKQ